MQSKNPNSIIISIAAGVTLQTLESALPRRKVIRVMPNTPCLIGQAASGYTMGTQCIDPFDATIVPTIFGSVGLVLHLPKEELLNSVTGLSGSGPAYVYEFIEALADGGVRVGLNRADALVLAAQTVKGAADMILQTGTHPAVLKDQGRSIEKKSMVFVGVCFILVNIVMTTVAYIFFVHAHRNNFISKQNNANIR